MVLFDIDPNTTSAPPPLPLRPTQAWLPLPPSTRSLASPIKLCTPCPSFDLFLLPAQPHLCPCPSLLLPSSPNPSLSFLSSRPLCASVTFICTRTSDPLPFSPRRAVLVLLISRSLVMSCARGLCGVLHIARVRANDCLPSYTMTAFIEHQQAFVRAASAVLTSCVMRINAHARRSIKRVLDAYGQATGVSAPAVRSPVAAGATATATGAVGTAAAAARAGAAEASLTTSRLYNALCPLPSPSFPPSSPIPLPRCCTYLGDSSRRSEDTTQRCLRDERHSGEQFIGEEVTLAH